MYLAWPEEIATKLKDTAKGRGDTILYEEKAWTARAFAAGTVDRIPADWRLTDESAGDCHYRLDCIW